VEYQTESGLFVDSRTYDGAATKHTNPNLRPPVNAFVNDAIAQQVQQMVMNNILTQDTFRNLPARLGAYTPNLLNGTEYGLTRLTENYQLLINMYRNHWIVRRIVDTIPEDATRNWIRITSEIKPEQMDKFDQLWNKNGFREKLLLGLKWGRLYGGAVGIIAIRGHEDILDQPLELDTVMPGALANLIVVDRWVGAYPSEELVEDISDREFGLPKYYMVTLQNGVVLNVHHSRVIRFTGPLLPYWEQLAEVYWGESVVEIVYEELKKRDNVSFNIASLTFLANLRVLKMNSLGDNLAINNTKVQQNLFNTLQAQNWLMSNMGLYVMSKDDEFNTHQYAFSGLNEIYESFMMDVSGATEIPVTRLFGRSPAGMNATGESDLQNYYETLQKYQDAHIAPALNKLLPVMAMSVLGYVPDDLGYDFNPVRTPTDKETAEIVQQKTDAVVKAHQEGLISDKVSMMELKQMSQTTGLFSNITDKDIEKADDTIGLQQMFPRPGGESGNGSEARGQEEDMGFDDLEPSTSGRTTTTDGARGNHASTRPFVDKVRDALRHIRASRRGK
jgi:phage-related protein (TIGR01555 family)